MASAEHKHTMGTWRDTVGAVHSHQWSPGAEPLVRGQETKPPEAEHFFCVVICVKWRKAAVYALFYGH